ncbi:hypothetical protein WMF11_29800 [Sorangium sp. So ce295]|uniref:hypothetical protein n=1 Tax=Sorangium sp. So ce295 TaxID=3133295 RepID=UPI003F5D941C
MTLWFRRSTQVLMALGSLSLAAPAGAQDAAAAEELFNRGLADMGAGKYEAGCTALAESEQLDPQPGTLFTLAMCESRWGRVATAVTQLGNYLAWVERMSPAQRARQGHRPKVARDERERLASRVPRLSLALPEGAPPGTVVLRDGSPLGPASLGVALPVDPGEHRMSTRAPGGPVWEQRVTIAEGETKTLTLEIKLAPAPDAPAQPPALATSPATTRNQAPTAQTAPAAATAAKGWRTATYVTGGLGVAGLVAGGVMGALVIGKRSVVSEHCGSAIQASNPKSCDATGLDAAQSGNTMALVSTVSFGVGLTALGAAAVLGLTAPGRAAPASPSGTMSIRGTVLQVGPSGTVLGAQGRF